MCTQLIEASNIANIYPDLDILYITGAGAGEVLQI